MLSFQHGPNFIQIVTLNGISPPDLDSSAGLTENEFLLKKTMPELSTLNRMDSSLVPWQMVTPSTECQR